MMVRKNSSTILEMEAHHMKKKDHETEFDFALVVDGVRELTPSVEDALFEAGCDDATLSIQYGRLYVEVSRAANSLEEAILSAISDIHKAGVGATVVRIDECSLVSPAQIARKIGRSRQLVYQYMTGRRGPGGFPAPACHLSQATPLWSWCEVSAWLEQHNLIRPDESWNARVIAVINNQLELNWQQSHDQELVRQVERALHTAAAV